MASSHNDGVPSSQIWYVKVSSPTNPRSGVYVIVPSGFNTTLPLAGSVTDPGVTVIISPSGSKSFDNTTIATGIPASVVAVSLFATGGLFTSFIGISDTSITTFAVSQACGVPSSHIV